MKTIKKILIWTGGIIAVSFILGFLMFNADDTTRVSSHTVISEEDISYAGCNRVKVSVVMQNPSQNVLDTIRDSYLTKWDDVTIFAYSDSAQSEVVGSSEVSNCN